jgi:hypothetical protein
MKNVRKGMRDIQNEDALQQLTFTLLNDYDGDALRAQNSNKSGKPKVP